MGTTWRLLGPRWGIRRVRASPRDRSTPAHRSRPPSPNSCRRASASWRTGAGPGPREAHPVGGVSSGSRGSPMAPRLSPPRVRAPFLCGRPSLSGRWDRPNWFLRSGIVPPVSLPQPWPPRTAEARGGSSRRPSLCPSRRRRRADGRLVPGLTDAARVEPQALGAPQRW